MKGGGWLTGALILAAGVGLGYWLRPTPVLPPAPPAPPDYSKALRRIEWYARACEGLVIRHGDFNQAEVDQISQQSNR